MSSRWIAVAKKLLDSEHELHPNRTGEPACRAFAWIDLIGLAAWEPDDENERGVVAGFSERDLAERWNWSRSKVTRFMAYLEREDMIERPNHQPNHQPNQLRICNYDKYQKARTTNRTTNRTTHSIYIQDIQKETSDKPPEPDVLELWEYFRAERKSAVPDARDLKLTRKRRSRIEKQLYNYSAAELRRAIWGMLHSPFHVENGYTDIELALRNEEKVDRFLELADRYDQAQGNEFTGGRDMLAAIYGERST